MDREVDLVSGARLIVRGVESDGSVVNADVELIDPSGARWGATVLTLAEIGRLMRSYQQTGECLSGRYFRVPDLLILSTPTLDSLVQVAQELLLSGAYQFEFSLLLDDG